MHTSRPEPYGPATLLRAPETGKPIRPGSRTDPGTGPPTAPGVPAAGDMPVARFETNRAPGTRFPPDRPLRKMVLTMLAIAFVLVAGISLLGVFVNKVAPLD